MEKYIPNKKYKILSFKDECPIAFKDKLLSLGLLPGNIIKIKRQALFGGPYQISIRNSELSIRVKDLNLINFEEI